MNRPARTHDTLVYRLSEVLTKLNQGDSLDPQELADEFGVNLRTIQRDLNVRFAGLPLVKVNGRYTMDEAHLGKLTIRDIERFAVFSGVNGLFPEMSGQFLKEVFASNAQGAWLVKGHHYEDLRDIAHCLQIWSKPSSIDIKCNFGTTRQTAKPNSAMRWSLTS
jgi:hypothetical protein